MKHVGLVKRDGLDIVEVQYVVSKFDREVGDTMKIEGETLKVEVVGNSRGEVISQLNEYIRAYKEIKKNKRR